MMQDTKTTIDWLRFRVQAEPRDVLESLRPMYGELGGSLAMHSLERGILGFRSAVQLNLLDIPIGRMDFGGESQRGWCRVDLSGKACQWVRDWDATEAVQDLEKAQVRRLDIALTTWDGEVSHDSICAAHKAGKFNLHGRQPELKEITSSKSYAGKTCYIGSRESAQFLRCYEKGFELLAKSGMPENMKPSCNAIDGKPIDGIYRVELELKPVGRAIPWETIVQRDQYFAGAYQFNAELLPDVEPDILQRDPRREPQRELAALLKVVQHQYGKTLYTALMAHHGDISTVWDRIVGHEHNQRLVDAGVLMVEHE